MMKTDGKDSARESHAPPPRPRSVVKPWLLAVLALGGCAGLVWHNLQLVEQGRVKARDLDDALAASNTCNEQLGPALTRAESCESERDDTAKDNAQLSQAQEKLAADLHATASEVASLRKLKVEAEARAAQFEDLKRRLQSLIDTKQLQVERREGRLVVQLPAEVLFASGSADLSQEGKVALYKLSAALESMPDRKWMIAGHTDSYLPAKGSKFRTNWELSTARAVNVTQLLVDAKLDPKNLVAAGYGEFAPIATNDTEDGREQNRRIEIVLLPDLDELSAFDAPAKAETVKAN